MIGGLSIRKEDLDSARRAAKRWADEAMLAARRHWARLGEPIRPAARAFFVVGCQRSGTSMLARAIRRSPFVDLYNESDARAFDHLRIRSPQVTNQLVRSSRGRVVLFKPICDSQNVPRLLLDHNLSRCVWLYRDVNDVARSCVRAWGDHLTFAIRTVLTNREQAGWYAEHVTPARLQQVAELARRPLNPESGAALFWFLRNGLYFDQQLSRDPRVQLVKYDDILQSPSTSMRSVLDFAELPWCDDSISKIRGPVASGEALHVDPKIAAACADLMARLDESRVRGASEPARLFAVASAEV